MRATFAFFLLTTVALLYAGCIDSQLAACGDNICILGQVCSAAGQCGRPEEILPCESAAENDRCSVNDLVTSISNGRCIGGICTAVGCGTSRIDIAAGEVCADDDRNNGDGCSSDCKSNETCGNGQRDDSNREQCDDGNLLSRDGCSSDCVAEAPAWIPYTPENLAEQSYSERNYVFDVARNRVLLYLPDRAELWEFKGKGWRKVNVAGAKPDSRTTTCIVYDPERRSVVLFGGQNSLMPLSDTWEFDGTGWSKLTPLTTPPARGYHAMTYDNIRRQVIAFGGRNLAGMSLNDVWALDRQQGWKLIGNGFPGENGNNIAFDSRRDRFVVYEGGPLQRTWIFDSAGWRAIDTPSVGQVRSAESVAYDPLRGTMIRFGGIDDQNGFNLATSAFAVFDNEQWIETEIVDSPPGRFGATILFDPNALRMLVVGGLFPTYDTRFGNPIYSEEYRSDLWALDANGWTSVAGRFWSQRRIPISARRSVLAYDRDNARTISLGLVSSFAESFSAMFEFDEFGWRYHPSNQGPYVTSNAVLVYDQNKKQLVIFERQSATLSRTWLVKQNVWTEVTAGSPNLNPGYRMVYDSSKKKVVVVGTGPDATEIQVWDFDGTWQRRPVLGDGPSARSDAALSFDSMRNRVVLFGGRDSAGSCTLSDTWELADNRWTQVNIVGEAPIPRCNAASVFDPRFKGVLMFGGRQSTTFLSDTWVFDGTSWSSINIAVPPSNLQNVSMVYDERRNVVVMHYDTGFPSTAQTWELTFGGAFKSDSCTGADDLDGDGRRGCADEDCWQTCDPQCSPFGSLACQAGRPKCGDGVCQLDFETSLSCPGDCVDRCGDAACNDHESLATCAMDCVICGDLICSAPERKDTCPIDCQQ
jgi:cysteine-rich repeat protein